MYMLRKGFTLIELLIVITIIAILAGAAIPYVQDYVEDARISRAKSDMDEIRSALIRYELDRGTAYVGSSTASLVGPYLDKAPIDPWGVPYRISATSSIVFTYGPNRDTDYDDLSSAVGLAGSSGDDIPRDFRPPLSLSKAYWVDVDKSGTVNDLDKIKVRLTRPALKAHADLLDQSNWNFAINGVDTTLTAIATLGINEDPSTATVKEVELTLTTVGATVFIPGRDTLNYVPAGAAGTFDDSAAAPFGPNECRDNKVLIGSF
jgi:general secretion pathway protein G